jgi:AraC-like DNA-binding protein
MQIAPGRELSGLVKHFLILENDSLDGVVHRLIPDGNPGIVFHYGVPFLQRVEGDGGHVQQPLSFIYGQVTKTVELISQGQIGMIVVVLQPWAVSCVTGRPAHRFTNAICDLAEIWGEQGMGLSGRVLTAADRFARLALIEAFLRGKCTTAMDVVVLSAIDWMVAHPESGSINELVALLPIGERQLERAFKMHVGVSPKMFATMIRMQYFLKSISRPGDENLTSLAYDSGYYDQAHLVRTFKLKSGVTPGRYRAVRDFLALNFIQFVD